MVVINIDAFGRTFFHAPLHGVNEFTELSLVGILFLQIGDATRRCRLTRSDGFLNILLRSRPPAGRVLAAFFDLLGALFMVLIIVGSVPLLMDAINYGHYVGEEGLVTFPVWPVKLVVVIGSAVMLVQFLLFARRRLRDPAWLSCAGPSVPGGSFK
jgi:TRAP-type C4-dicarboxylate transport system permease small subunit